MQNITGTSSLHLFYSQSSFSPAAFVCCCFSSSVTGLFFHLSCSLCTVSHSFKSCIFCLYSHGCEMRKSRSCVLRNNTCSDLVLFCSQFWHWTTGQVKPFFLTKEIQCVSASSLSGLDCLCFNSTTLG